MRLHTLIKNSLNLTKSEVMALYKSNKILVNGKHEKLSMDVKEEDFVIIDGKVISTFVKKYYLYNKDVGIVCTNNRNVKDNISSKLLLAQKVYTVGRLDKDSHGLLILTNDGILCNYIKSKKVDKEYLITLKEKITSSFIEKMTSNHILRGKIACVKTITILDDYHLFCVLNEGMYREIRRIVILSNNRVIDLQRVRIGNITLDDLGDNKIKEVTFDFIKNNL